MHEHQDAYISLNALSKFKDRQGHYHFDADKEAVKLYLQAVIEPKKHKFADRATKLDYLIAHNYYDKQLLERYDRAFVLALFAEAEAYNFTFAGLMGALKFYSSYALMSDDKQEYFEDFADRAVMNALFLADGEEKAARAVLREIMSQRFQPATPTFLNAGKARRGEYVSCYLLRLEDSMESIGRAVATSLQLSKRGGGVALCLTNLRETGAPIKGMSNQASGVVPVMKLLEDSFSYANQLGQRQGAGAVYLQAHHKDILQFLDTKRENADEKVRIKSLSLGVVIPDITFELAKANKDMALFSPYEIQQVYGKPMSDISITAEYENLLHNPAIHKTYISARRFFQTIAELHFESGYPYILFEDTVNAKNPQKNLGRICMSNLCSEIAQVSTASTYEEDLTFKTVGQDICCNLGSLNIAAVMENAVNMAETVDVAVQALDTVAHNTDLNCAPSVKEGNSRNHAIGLGAMNLHGFLAQNSIYYDSPAAVEFTDIFFYTLAYYAFSASNKLAKKRGAFAGFAQTSYADGSYFSQYVQADKEVQNPQVKALLAKYNLQIPTAEKWRKLVAAIKTDGLANSHLLAVAPTGSISYLTSCTPSLQAAVSPVEVRKEGKTGRVYVPAYRISADNYKYYEKGAYEVGAEAIIDIAAAAAKHVDQAVSLTLFMTDKSSTRDLNKAYIYAFKKGCPSIYYVRIRQEVLPGSEHLEDDAIIDTLNTCQSCMI
ncbi:class 1b ribonucleoside-diphosphate reductase subunit alpha [Amygdalobacter indicium]|uniref:class 1b ribonucleoside-diphosphate reductase subunit alpha n=1 Tax=Amygdalobacter indicium TaxID=3029272 RepID=UPI0027A5A6BE|nr:class 1b ribonucleoside-diphosphate reductase subunit alpha [Amygdalobacter indicium]WEG34845.1 class 1b ribonucleoside-diphosphate reductase subunit alpha [Amygdalobacter indicium]